MPLLDRRRPEGLAGILYRHRYLADLFARRSAVDVLEICSDHYLDATPEVLEELDLLADHFPLLPHGINLSIGSADGVRSDYLERLARVIARLDPPWYSDHLAFTRIGEREVGHLVPLPRTRAALEALERNVESVRARIGSHRLALENIAAGFEWPGAEYAPGDFVAEALRRTGCDLVLDVANLVGDAFNLGHDPRAFIAAIPPERIVQVHVAGGRIADGHFVDSHSDATPESVWGLLDEVVARAHRAGVPAPVTIVEREEALPPFESLAREVARARTAGASPAEAFAR